MALPANREPGREPVTIVEIDQDFCQEVYGVAPCAAVLGTTGLIKCFNTRKTCQDAANYNPAALTLRFATATALLADRSITMVPSVMEVTTRPTRINTVTGDTDYGPLGRRAEVTVTLADHPGPDIIVDKYRTERSWYPNASARGSFWGKWLARNPYHNGRAMRVRDGYAGEALAAMTTRHYVIDRIEGPDRDGMVRVVARDPLALAEAGRAVAPAANTGSLAGDIDEVATSFSLQPAGIGDAEYPASGIGRIGSESVAFTRSADTVTLTARGRRGTEAASHSTGDAFQVALVYAAVRVDAVINDLLTAHAGMASALIPITDWQAEATTWQGGTLLSREIYDPTPVDRLIGEILEETFTFIWWDERGQEVKYRALRPTLPGDDVVAALTGEGNILADSVDVVPDPRQRLTQVHVYYDPFNPLVGVEEPSNYGRLQVARDAAAEAADQYGDERVRTIFAPWLTASQAAEASVLGFRLLARFRDAPRDIAFQLDAKDRAIWTGDIVDFTHRSIQDDTGAEVSTRLQIIAAEETRPGHRAEYEAVVFAFADDQRRAFIVDDAAPTFDLASEAERASGAWISDNSGQMSDGSPAYRII